MDERFTQPESMGDAQIADINDPSAFDPNVGGNSTVYPQQYQQPPVQQQQYYQQPMQPQMQQPNIHPQQYQQPQQNIQQPQPNKFIPPHCVYILTSGNLLITIDLPGINKEHIDVEYDEPNIHIRANREQYKDDIDLPKDIVNKGTYYGNIDLSFKMTKLVEEFEASFKDGTLILNIIFRSKNKPTKISLK